MIDKEKNMVTFHQKKTMLCYENGLDMIFLNWYAYERLTLLRIIFYWSLWRKKSFFFSTKMYGKSKFLAPKTDFELTTIYGYDFRVLMCSTKLLNFFLATILSKIRILKIEHCVTECDFSV